MTYEQKLIALSAFSPCSLRVAAPGKWRADWIGVELKTESILSGLCGYGTTPEKAVEDLWAQATDIFEAHYLVANAGNKTMRKAARWNGFMWDLIDEHRT